MRSSADRLGAGLALGAVLLLSHPPVTARPMVLHSFVCGSGAVIDIPIGGTSGRGRPRNDDGRCMPGCHAVCPARKRLVVR